MTESPREQSPDTSDWIDVGPLADLEFKPGACVEIDGREIAVFEQGGAFHALDNTCPHAGGALADGCLYEGEIACNWHSWRFALDSGKCRTFPGVRVKRHEARVEDGRLLLRLRLASG